MSPSDVLITADYYSPVIAVIISLLVMYRAWSLRRVLVDPVYRNRALWTGFAGLAALGFLVATGGNALVTEGYGIFANQTVGLIAEDVWYGFIFLGLYGWIYTNINVAISSDFLHRDVLWWNRIGKTLTLVSMVISYLLVSLPAIPQDQSLLNFGNDIIGPVFAIATIYMAAVLAIGYRRIKDRLIKRYTMWVVLTLAAFFLAVFIFSSIYGISFPSIIAAYFMYRAAGSLSLRTRDIDQK